MPDVLPNVLASPTDELMPDVLPDVPADVLPDVPPDVLPVVPDVLGVPLTTSLGHTGDPDNRPLSLV